MPRYPSALVQLDLVAVRVVHERNDRAAADRQVNNLLKHRS